MALQPVPWATGNGADNAVEGARLALYAATQGARGVIGIGDMRVTALPVPGAAVRVHTGAATTPNDYIPGGGGQAYALREESSTDVPIPATGSSGGAVRYLVARVSDPQYAGAAPADPVHGPYNSYEWVSEKTGHPFPHVPLAKINQPANTATITPEMITDVREMAVPRRSEVMLARPSIGSDTGLNLTDKTWGGEWFPGGEGKESHYSNIDVDVPPWAVKMIIEAQWISVIYDGRRSWGSYWIEYGDQYKASGWEQPSPQGKDYEFSTQTFAWDTNETGFPSRVNWLLADHRDVPAKLRGKRASFQFKANVSTASTAKTGVAKMDASSGLMLRITWIEDAFYWQDAG